MVQTDIPTPPKSRGAAAGAFLPLQWSIQLQPLTISRPDARRLAFDKPRTNRSPVAGHSRPDASPYATQIRDLAKRRVAKIIYAITGNDRPYKHKPFLECLELPEVQNVGCGANSKCEVLFEK